MLSALPAQHAIRPSPIRGGLSPVDKKSMLSSIAVLAASLPLAIVLERLILRLASVPFSALFQPDAVAPRILTWQTPRWRDAMARTFALILPLLLALTALRFEPPDVFVAGVVVAALVVCCATDLLAYRVPNIVTIPALVVVLTAAALSGMSELLDATLGLPVAPLALGAGIVAGSLVVIALQATGELKRGDVFPYAPFLSIAALVVLFL